MTRPSSAASWGLGALVVAAVTLVGSLSRPAFAAETRRELASDELYWAFHACEEGMQTETTALRRVQLLDDYKFRRARAIRADAAIVRTPKVRDYAVREWLQRCDVSFPKVASEGRKQAAEAEVEAALAQCKTATERGSLEQAEADYKAFKQRKQNAMKLDPKIAAKGRATGPELEACDKRVSDWIAKRRQVEENALKRYREDAEKALSAAKKGQNLSLAVATVAPR